MTVSAPQLGKTIAVGLWLLVGAWRDAEAGIRLPSWWSAPTFGMAEQGVEKLSEMARSAGVLRDVRMTSPPRIVLRNGGVIEARSWDVPSNLYGPTVARIAIDEFGWLTAEAHAALKSRVSETRTRGLGYVRYVGNVGEIGGEAESIWQHATSGAPGWAARVWTWRDRVAAAECVCGMNGQGHEIEQASLHEPGCERGRYLTELADLRGRMSDAHFRQLYGAEWLDWSNLPAYTFDRSVHVTKDVHLDPHLPLDLACDFNVDPMCWVIGQHTSREAWAWDEIVLEGGATTQAACAEFLRRYPGELRELLLYGDPAGNARSTKSNRSDYDIIRAALSPTWPRLRSCVASAHPAVSDRLNAVNAMLRTGSGEVHYYIHPRCKILANDLARVSLKPGTREIDKSNKRLTHASDAEGYRIHREFPVRGPSVEVPRSIPSPLLHEQLQEATW